MGGRRKYFSYEDAKQHIAKFQFPLIQDYKKWVIENNIKYLPKDPATYLYQGYKPHDFLGLDEETYKKNVYEFRLKTCEYMSTRPRTSVYKKRSDKIELRASDKIIVGLNLPKLTAFLIKEDIAPETVFKIIEELDIKSSRLMEELLKYMQMKSKQHSSNNKREKAQNSVEL
jgi:hypothetical protein